MANIVRQRGYYNGTALTIVGLNQWNSALSTFNFPVPRDSTYMTIVGHMLVANLGNNTAFGTAFFLDSVPATGAPVIALPQSISLTPYPGATVMHRRHTTLSLPNRDLLNLFFAIRVVGGTTDTSQVVEASMMIWFWN